MIQKKICMLGAFAVGKTSLVSQFVTPGFSEKYLTTVGVKIDKKTVSAAGQDIDLILWDIQGEENSQQLFLPYLRGLAGYLLVVDGTRRATLVSALEIRSTVASLSGPDVPYIVVANKNDLHDDWEITDSDLEAFGSEFGPVVKTSAKTGESVEAVFHRLTTHVLQRSTDGPSGPGA